MEVKRDQKSMILTHRFGKTLALNDGLGRLGAQHVNHIVLVHVARGTLKTKAKTGVRGQSRQTQSIQPTLLAVRSASALAASASVTPAAANARFDSSPERTATAQRARKSRAPTCGAANHVGDRVDGPLHRALGNAAGGAVRARTRGATRLANTTTQRSVDQTEQPARACDGPKLTHQRAAQALVEVEAAEEVHVADQHEHQQQHLAQSNTT